MESINLNLILNKFLKNVNVQHNYFPFVCFWYFSYEWWVPLTYTTKSENKFNKERTDVEWFNTTSQGIVLSLTIVFSIKTNKSRHSTKRNKSWHNTRRNEWFSLNYSYCTEINFHVELLYWKTNKSSHNIKRS